MKHAREDYNRIQDPENIIPENEPVFLLRGKDVAAPAAIEEWVRTARRYGANKNILQAALDQAEKMRVWQIEQGGKIPDMP